MDMTLRAIAAKRLYQPWLPLAAALIGYAIGLFSPRMLADGDTYLHIAAGEWILRHGAVPHVDPFSYSHAGAPWLAHEWLAQVAMALAWRAGAWNGVLVMFALATALSFGLLAHHLQRWLTPLPALALLAIALACISRTLLARPHLLALPVLELWTAGLLLARTRGTPPSPLLLPLIALWANLHGGFAFGLALVGPLALEALIEAKHGRAAVVRGWGLFLAGAVLLALATPYGPDGLLFPLHVLGMKQMAHVGEWRPLDFSAPQPTEAALLGLLCLGLWFGVRLPIVRLLIVLGLVHMTLQHSRHQILLGLVGALVLAEPVAAAARRDGAPTDGTAPPRRRAGAAMLTGIAALALLTLLRAAFPLVRGDDPMSPVTALAHVPRQMAAEPVFNDYSFGTYLIFAGLHPFIDSRADMYGDAFLAAYRKITHPDPAAFAAAAAEYGFRWTILRPGNPLVGLLDVLPGWRRAYADKFAVVHVRDEPAR